MIYVVLGMHKSGTTLVSQLLHHSGINMGSDLANGVSYDGGNQYERAATRRLNEAILQARQVRSIDVHMPEAPRLSAEQQACMREIITTCSQQHKHWGFKDPRTCLVYPLWAAELPAHRLIVVYRHPGEPWPRYRPRHARNRFREPFVAWKYLHSWCEHNRRILTYLQQATQPAIVLEYERLVTTQDEFARLQRFIGRPLADRRRPTLYRNHRRAYPVLDAAAWLLEKQKGYHPEAIWQQLEASRQCA